MEQRAAELMGKAAGISEKVTVAAVTSSAGMSAAKTFCGILLSDWSFIVAIFTTLIVGMVTVYCKLAHIALQKRREMYGKPPLPDDDDE